MPFWYALGMTGMPETILARELNIDYACIGIVTNKAAGRRAGITITKEDIGTALKASINELHNLIEQVIFNFKLN